MEVEREKRGGKREGKEEGREWEAEGKGGGGYLRPQVERSRLR